MISHTRAIVIGVSAGGFEALTTILPCLPKNYAFPILIVQHMHPNSDGFFASYLNDKCRVHVKEAEDRESIEPGRVYLAPANYHLLVETDKCVALEYSERVNHSRPSIDVLFESASEVYRKNLTGVILTGANYDGSQGLRMIAERGGMTLVQDPETAEVDSMPRAALEAVKPDKILPLIKMGPFLSSLRNRTSKKEPVLKI